MACAVCSGSAVLTARQPFVSGAAAGANHETLLRLRLSGCAARHPEAWTNTGTSKLLNPLMNTHICRRMRRIFMRFSSI